MSKNKGFSETSAGRYSLALYELAVEANNLSEIEVHSASIINLIASSEDFKSLIKDPTLETDRPTLIAGLIPWLNNSVSRNI
ncbi:F0F1 ATP synthase subunit delta [Candidatus Pelagibacter sp.]|nr:F0F1 ATP synthase subunit delta [Candidatus Pelagibacter sp.]